MRKIQSIFVKRFRLVAVLCAAAVMSMLILSNRAYAIENGYTVSGGLNLISSSCAPNDNEERWECSLSFAMMERPLEDYSSGTWIDYFCAKFIGYSIGKNEATVKNSTSWYSASLSTEATNGNCGGDGYQMGIFQRNASGVIYGFGGRKSATIKFNVSYDNFKSKASKQETEGGTTYTGSICWRNKDGWHNYGARPFTNVDYCFNNLYLYVPKPQYYTLIAKSIDTSGASLSNVSGLGDKSSGLIKSGNAASVQHGNNGNYEFKGWKKNKSDSGFTGGNSLTYYLSSLTKNTVVYAVYEKKPDVSKYDLYVSKRNIYNDSIIGTRRVYTFNENQWKNIGHEVIDGYKFIGWKTEHSEGVDGLMDWTSSVGHKTYLDPDSDWEGAYYYTTSGVKKQIYTNVYNYFDNSRNLYAYYAPKYELSIDVDDGVMLTVNRKFSYYSSRGVINENNAIFKDDRLKICLTVRNGYTLSKFTIKSGSGSAVSISPSSKYCTDVIADGYNVTNDTTIVAKTAKNEFEGMVRVSEVADAWTSVPDSKKASTGWTNVNGKKIIYNIQNCDPVNGCTVQFYHWLRRKSGDGGTTYSISRTSNYETITSDNSVLSGMEEFSDSTSSMVKKETFKNKLFPGQVVCEKLTFAADSSVGYVSITACAFALGKAQPENPNGNSTLLDLKVKNNNVSKYNNPSSEVWAKPGDRLTFSSTYNPVLQYTYSLIPEKMKINGSGIQSNSNGRYLGKNNSSMVKSMFNSYKPNTMSDWNNAYYVHSDNFKSVGFQKVYKFDGGDKMKREGSEYNNDHVVDKSEVGLGLIEKAEINYGRDGGKCQSDSCTTPSQVEFTNESNYNVANVKTDNIEKMATAYVPYNFNTGAEVLTEDSKTFFAGEKASVTFGVSVLKRVNNETTDGTEAQAYATRMHNAKVKMIFYYADSATSGIGSWGSNATDLCSYFGLTNNGQDCGYAKELGNDENSPLTLEPKADGSANEYSATVNVKDVRAGSKICAAVAVYPSNSGYDRQLSSFGSGTWRISDSKCFSIAKKPSFQVWGGSVYSAGKIDLKVSAKNNMPAYSSLYPYSMTGSGNNRVFGSWVELGVVANGAVKGLSSGAGTGYSRVSAAGEISHDGQGVPLGMRGEDLGGSAEGTSTNYCVRSTLSFANNNCKGSSGAVGGLSGALRNNAVSNKRALISEFTDENGAGYTIETAKEIGEIKDFVGTVVVNDDGVESLKTTRVIASTGSIKINGNIEYADSGYTGLGEVPKIIIYSGKNILISCDVTRIDAVLIAEKAISTCSDSEDVNDEARSKQLKINGSIISDTLTLGRTYGAATGAWSIAPAEIINYDTSLYLWSRKMNVTTSTDKLVEAYTNELAPRY